MPPQVIGFCDLGTETIKHNGNPVTVGVISFRTVENESPVDYIGRYRLNYKDSIIKNLKRIVWAKPEVPVVDDLQVTNAGQKAPVKETEG